MFGRKLTIDDGDATASFVQILLNASDASNRHDAVFRVEYE
jgi:hypothetical protein